MPFLLLRIPRDARLLQRHIETVRSAGQGCRDADERTQPAAATNRTFFVNKIQVDIFFRRCSIIVQFLIVIKLRQLIILIVFQRYSQKIVTS